MKNIREIPSSEIQEALSEQGKEALEIKPADCIIFFGRGIEKVSVKGGTEPVWKPTRLVQELVKDQATGRHVRTGSRKVGQPLENFEDGDEVKEMVGGGNASVIAAVEAYEYLSKNYRAPKEVVISGGRPGYLDKESEGLSEAGVMKQQFLKRLNADIKIRKVGEALRDPENVTVLDASRNTEDDLMNSMQYAIKKGYGNVILINASIAMERTKAFWEHTVLPKHPELKTINVQFIEANDLLKQRMGAKFSKIEESLKATKAYTDTVENESIGTKKVKGGEYGTGGRGKGNY